MPGSPAAAAFAAALAVPADFLESVSHGRWAGPKRSTGAEIQMVGVEYYSWFTNAWYINGLCINYKWLVYKLLFFKYYKRYEMAGV